MKKLYQSNFKLISFCVAIIFSLLVSTSYVFAYDDDTSGWEPPSGAGHTQAYIGSAFNVETFIGYFYRIALPIAVILGLIYVAKAGYAIMFSEGDPRRVSEGKEDLTSAIMGLLFVLLSVAILRIIFGQLIIGGSAGF